MKLRTIENTNNKAKTLIRGRFCYLFSYNTLICRLNTHTKQYKILNRKMISRTTKRHLNAFLGFRPKIKCVCGYDL